jgi:elongation factor 3
MPLRYLRVASVSLDFGKFPECIYEHMLCTCSPVWYIWFTLIFVPSTQELVSRGFGKMIAEYDGKLASAAGDKKALTRANVENYLSDFGLDSELASHSHIKGLSGGQKVKLVLAAAMWNHPHFLIMDEPTNYLDRDSLGALAGAIREFQGGVLLISHNAEFTSALCPEVWAVNDGVVTVKKSDSDSKDVAADASKKEDM